MNNKKKIQVWTRSVFWILMFLYLTTYFVTRYMNENPKFGSQYRFLNTLWFIPTHRVTWKSYILSPEQLKRFLLDNVLPKKRSEEGSISPDGTYFIVFRMKTDQHRVHSAQIKCYVEGVKFPIDFEVYPGRDKKSTTEENEFKDYIIPVHIDSSKIKTAPHLNVYWTSMFRW